MIPNIIHFIYGLERKFGNKPFGLIYYLAVKSAYIVNKPEKIYFFYRYEPSGYWWEKTKELVTLVQISVPRKIFGNKLYHYAHKADVIRLLALGNYGGIYLDIDTICIKPFSNLLSYDFVMGEQWYNGQIYGLCNAIILSNIDSLFLKFWYGSYKFFRSKGRDIYWDENSVSVPLNIAKMYPGHIHIEPQDSFFYPSCSPSDVKSLFEECKDFPNAYVFHLWESITYDEYLSKMTIDDIINKDTSYNIIARRYL